MYVVVRTMQRTKLNTCEARCQSESGAPTVWQLFVLGVGEWCLTQGHPDSKQLVAIVTFVQLQLFVG